MEWKNLDTPHAVLDCWSSISNLEQQSGTADNVCTVTSGRCSALLKLKGTQANKAAKWCNREVNLGNNGLVDLNSCLSLICCFSIPSPMPCCSSCCLQIQHYCSYRIYTMRWQDSTAELLLLEVACPRPGQAPASSQCWPQCLCSPANADGTSSDQPKSTGKP